MARSVRGRITHGGLPSWPPLRLRALVNGLCLTVFGAALFYATWNLLGFRVFDATQTAMVLRVLAIWCAVALPLGCLAIGLHLMLTAVTANDRLLLSHGAVTWDPGQDDPVLRGARVRNWRPKTGTENGAFSARTLGWIPVQTPLTLLPLALGLLVGLGLTIWLATGYGRAALIMLVSLAWMGWRAWRAWGAWTDFRTHRQPPLGPGQQAADSDGGRVVVITADEAWDHDDDPAYQPSPHPNPYQREQQLRQAMADDSRSSHRGNDVRVEAVQDPASYGDDTTDMIPVYRDPDTGPEFAGARHPEDTSTGRIPLVDHGSGSPLHPGRARSKANKRDKNQQQAAEPVELVDRSAERARQARLRRQGSAEDGAPRGDSRSRVRKRSGDQSTPQPAPGRGRGRGLRGYFGDRVTAEEADARSAGRQRSPSGRSQEAPTAQMRTVRRTGAPSKAEAERDIYDRTVEADSIFGYVLRKRHDD
ncbi:hypothetical protein [Kocuria sp.]|uniref:hypothetical protein n=1 Tax=Kocuria sp. TaxID=1871328 RepID=UPI0026E0E5B6|nr:hypothetical protein [Kocuria sp.]MDO5619190.1 hypothetical protein [Kocuria sp.]